MNKYTFPNTVLMHKRLSNISWKNDGKTISQSFRFFFALFCLSSSLPIHLQPFEEKMILDFSMCFCSLTLSPLQISRVDQCFGGVGFVGGLFQLSSIRSKSTGFSGLSYNHLIRSQSSVLDCFEARNHLLFVLDLHVVWHRDAF